MSARRGRGVARPLVAAAAALLLWPAVAEAGGGEGARWLSEYLRIDTSNPPGGEHRAASYLAYLLHRERIPTRLLVSPGGRTSLYARLAAADPRGGALLLTHHTDVVPAGPGWTVGPFAGEVRDGHLWGRGALDTKGLGIVHLAALVDLKRRGVALSRDIAFLAVADEETGGREGMAWLVEDHPELFEGVAAVFNEGGGGRLAGGKLRWWEVEVSQKRPLWLALRTRGRGGHGSGLNPDSASHQLVHALARLLDLPQPYRVTPAARDYLRAIAPLHQSPHYRRIFGNIDAYLRPTGPTEKILPAFHRLFLDTVQVTGLKASASINVVAEQAAAQVDVRLLPDTDADAFLARLASALGPEVEVEVLLTAPPTPPSPAEGPAWQAVAQALGAEAPVVPGFASGFTDSRHFRARGIPAYGVTPFALDPELSNGAHGVDERIPLAELDRGTERMLRILGTFCR